MKIEYREVTDPFNQSQKSSVTHDE